MVQQFFAIRNNNGLVPEILVYGMIGSDDANSTDFVKAIKELEKKHNRINIRINSDGGSIIQGLAMYNAMVQSPANIEVFIDGLAASMAAVLAMGGRKVWISKHARIMTHSGSGAVSGNADTLRSTAALLDSLDSTMSVIYATRTGKTKEECLAQYVTRKGDKWFTAEQALAENLVDGIYDAEVIAVPGNLTGSAELWRFYNEHRFAAVFQSAQKQTDNMELKLTAQAIAKLGLPAETDIAAVDTAIDALVAKANGYDALNAEKENVEQELNTLKKENVAKEVDALLAQAQTSKKIDAAAADKFKAQFAENPAGLKTVLDALQPHQSVVAQLKPEASEGRLAELNAKTYAELDTEGLVPELKALSMDVFKAKFKEHYKTEYKWA